MDAREFSGSIMRAGAFVVLAVMAFAGCIRTAIPLGTSVCVGSTVMVSDGKYLSQSIPCDELLPGGWVCVQECEGPAYCMSGIR